jgi:regulator of protease activity HflC (stomatin/prohibitin superfamily)
MNKLKLLLASGLLGLGACTQVEAGHSAVMTNYGKPHDKSYGPGFYWYNPWSTDVIVMDVRQLKWTSATESYTRDVQKADIKFALNYHLRPSKAHTMYGRVGENWADNILPQATVEVIKDELGRVDAVTLVATRAMVGQKITERLRARLSKQDVVLDSFDITDISFTGEFEKAVEAKVTAVQTAIAEQNKTVAVTERAKQAVIKAKGDAEALSITSTALKGDPKLVEFEAIKAWKETGGKVPQTVVGNASPPFINLGRN